MEIALDAGADDVKSDDEDFEVLCQVSAYYALEQEFGNFGIKCTSSEIAYIPNTLVPIHDKETAEKIIKTVERLEDLDDVKNVFSNFDIDDSIDIEA